MAKSNENGRRELVEVLEEIENLESEKKQATEKIKAAYARLEGEPILVQGMPISASSLKQIIKDRKGDGEKTAKLRAEVDRIVKALGEFGDTELGEWAKNQAALVTSAKNQRAPKIPSRKAEDTLM